MAVLLCVDPAGLEFLEVQFEEVEDLPLVFGVEGFIVLLFPWPAPSTNTSSTVRAARTISYPARKWWIRESPLALSRDTCMPAEMSFFTLERHAKPSQARSDSSQVDSNEAGPYG